MDGGAADGVLGDAVLVLAGAGRVERPVRAPSGAAAVIAGHEPELPAAGLGADIGLAVPGPDDRGRDCGQLFGGHGLYCGRDTGCEAGAALWAGGRDVWSGLRGGAGAGWAAERFRAARAVSGRGRARGCECGIRLFHGPGKPAETAAPACEMGAGQSDRQPARDGEGLRLYPPGDRMVLRLVCTRRAADQLRAGQRPSAGMGAARERAGLGAGGRGVGAGAGIAGAPAGAGAGGTPGGVGRVRAVGAGLLGVRFRGAGLDSGRGNPVSSPWRPRRSGGAVHAVGPGRGGPAGTGPGCAGLIAGADGHRCAADCWRRVQRVLAAGLGGVFPRGSVPAGGGGLWCGDRCGAWGAAAEVKLLEDQPWRRFSVQRPDRALDFRVGQLAVVARQGAVAVDVQHLLGDRAEGGVEMVGGLHHQDLLVLGLHAQVAEQLQA